MQRQDLPPPIHLPSPVRRIINLQRPDLPSPVRRISNPPSPLKTSRKRRRLPPTLSLFPAHIQWWRSNCCAPSRHSRLFLSSRSMRYALSRRSQSFLSWHLNCCALSRRSQSSLSWHLNCCALSRYFQSFLSWHLNCCALSRYFRFSLSLRSMRCAPSVPSLLPTGTPTTPSLKTVFFSLSHSFKYSSIDFPQSMSCFKSMKLSIYHFPRSKTISRRTGMSDIL